MDPAIVTDPHARVPHTLIVRVWEELPQRCADPIFGLRAAQLIASRPFDVIDYIMRQCATIGDKIDRLMRYQRLMHDANQIRLELQGDRAHLSQRLAAAPPAPRHLTEFILAVWVLSSRVELGPDHGPDQVLFEHAAPPDVTAHQRFFRAELQFNAGVNALIFPRRLLATPMPRADPALTELLDRHALALLAGLPKVDDFLSALRHALREELPQGEPEVGRIAKRLHLSTRSLQRRLQQEGTTFVLLVDTLRRELALRYLEDQQLTLTEIGFMLGFAELSSFHRAFRRWTGTTPGQYRRGRLPQQEGAD